MGIWSLIHQAPCCYHGSFCFMTTLSSSGSPSLIGLISWVSHRNVLLNLLCPQQPQLQGTHDKTFKTIVFRAPLPWHLLHSSTLFQVATTPAFREATINFLGSGHASTWPESLHLSHHTLSQLHHLGTWNTGLKAEV